MSILRRSFLGSVALVGLALAACGTGTTSVSATDVASQVRGSLTDVKSGAATVTCAGPLAGTVGATDSCDVTVAGATTGLHLTVDSVDGGKIDWKQQPYLHGKDVAAAITTAKHLPASDLTCPDLNGTVGATISCTVNKGSATAVDVRVEHVNGLKVYFNYKAR